MLVQQGMDSLQIAPAVDIPGPEVLPRDPGVFADPFPERVTVDRVTDPQGNRWIFMSNPHTGKTASARADHFTPEVEAAMRGYVLKPMADFR